MRSFDRPYSANPRFEGQRDRDRSYRERESSRRRYGRRDDDDDRGPWISRDRDAFEPGDRDLFERDFDPFDPRENEYPSRRRFEQFEEWERPRELARPHGAHGRHAGQGGSYAGRGPKGYQRSDERLKEEICERLTADPDVDASEIEVSVQNGEVTLEGTVSTRQMKRGAEDCAEAVSGAQQVHNRLRVESNDFGRDEGRFSSSSDEGQRSSAGRKAH
jgi:hypothetical protein